MTWPELQPEPFLQVQGLTLNYLSEADLPVFTDVVMCRFRNDEVTKRLGTALATPVLASDGHRIGAM